MRIIRGAALTLALSSLGTIANAETWSCDVDFGKNGHRVVRYSVSNGQMTSSSISGGRVTSAPGSLRVTLNDDRFLVAFAKLSKNDPNPMLLIIIEKKSGSLLAINNILMTQSGYSDEGPEVEDNGQCALIER